MIAAVLSWWRDVRHLVAVPDGWTIHQGREVEFVSAPIVVVEDTQDLRASRAVIEAKGRAMARLVRRRRGRAWYRVDEPVRGRVASGHWLQGTDRRMHLIAIAIVPAPGFPIPRPSGRTGQ